MPPSVGTGYAGIASGRVINAKQSTARSSQQSSGQLWDRVAQAASSGASSSRPRLPPPPPSADRFPALQAALPTVPTGPAFRQGVRNTPWASSSSTNLGGFREPTPLESQLGNNSQPQSRVTVQPRPPVAAFAPSGPPPKLSKSLFPALPASTNGRVKVQASGNQSLKNILGETAPIAPAWQPNSGPSTGASTPAIEQEEFTDGSSSRPVGKGKKGKGKQKQTLFTLGSFPT